MFVISSNGLDVIHQKAILLDFTSRTD